MIMKVGLLVAFLFAVQGVEVTINDHVKVKGSIKEVKMENRKIAVEAFTGIQYATRSHMLAMPEAVEYDKITKRRTIRADVPGPHCPLVGDWRAPPEASTIVDAITSFEVNEVDALNCLRLDVFRAASALEEPNKSSHETLSARKVKRVGEGEVDTEKLKRVVVYIHGGSLENGGRDMALNQGEQLLRYRDFGEDTIVVMVGYSLGPFGFWAYETEGGRMANAALYECISALNWVQKHIEKFGGNPSDVTLMGHSAGATIAQWIQIILGQRHALRKFNFDTQPFQKLLLMSGTTELFSAIPFEKALERQRNILNEAGCEGVDPKDLTAALGCLNSESIIAGSKKAFVTWSFVQDDTIINEKPQIYIEQGKFLKVPVFMTMMQDDASLFCAVIMDELNSIGHEFWGELGQKHLKQHFLKHYPYSEDGPWSKLRAVIRAATDVAFTHPLYHMEHFYKEAGQPVFLHRIRLEFDQLNKLKDGALFKKAASMVTQITQSLGPARLKNFSLEKVMQIMDLLGSAHGFEQMLLFNALFINESTMGMPLQVRVDKLSSSAQMEAVFKPLRSFIVNGDPGEVNELGGCCSHSVSTKEGKNHCLASLVNVDEVVEALYRVRARLELEKVVVEPSPVKRTITESALNAISSCGGAVRAFFSIKNEKVEVSEAAVVEGKSSKKTLKIRKNGGHLSTLPTTRAVEERTDFSDTVFEEEVVKNDVRKEKNKFERTDVSIITQEKKVVHQTVKVKEEKITPSTTPTSKKLKK